MEKVNRILWGLVFIVLGVVVALNTLDIIDFNIFFRGWWTLIIIIPCFIGLFDMSNEGKLGNIIGLVIGFVLLFVAQGWLRFDLVFKLIVPAILVIIGLYMIFGNVLRNKITEKIQSIKKENKGESICATFSEQFVTKNDEKFESANIDAIFGSVVLDLTKAKIKDEAVVTVSAIFGGVDIIVPKDVEVKVKSTPIFGGVSNRCKTKDAKKIIYVDALALFGSVDIK